MSRCSTQSLLLVPGALALVLVGLGIGWIVFRAPEVLPSLDPAVESDEAEAAPSFPVLAGRSPVVDSGTGEAKPGDGGGTAVREVLARGEGGRIHVVFDVPKGWPLMRGTVYSLPAGSAGVDDVSSVPNAQLWKNEAGAIEVPFAGSWDVFYMTGWSAGAALDVDVPEGGAVEVRLAPHTSGRITFQLDGDMPEVWTRNRRVCIEVTSQGDPEPPKCPGRADGLTLRTYAYFDAHGTATTKPLPAGRRYTARPDLLSHDPDKGAAQARRRLSMRLSPHRLVLERTVVEAGETVGAHILDRVSLRVTVRLDRAPPAAWKGWVPKARLQLHVTGGDGGDGYVRAKPGKRPGTPPGCMIWSDPGEGRLTWSGGGIERGALEGIPLVAGERNEVEIVLRVDPGFSPKEAFRTKPEDLVRVHVEGWPRDADENAELCLFGPKPGAEASRRCEELDLHYGRKQTYHRLSFEPRTVSAIVAPDLVSRPATITTDGELRLRLERGGYLVVVPDRVRAGGSGGIVLERGDGAPFPASSLEEPGSPPCPRTFGVRMAVGAGWLVGPLLPGEHRFRVTLGAVRLPDATGRVRAGRFGVLHVR